jgi:dTDP-4-amino-4,6-dideoxygalactose transaminase
MTVKVPLNDLTAQYATIKADIDAAIARTLADSSYVLGPAVAQFERDFAAHCGAKHCVGVSSGTDALHLALLVAGVGPGDEVITTTMTFVSTAAAIRHTGARPVLVDCDPVTRNISPEAVARAITSRTRAILPVHLHGLVCDMDPILALARTHGLMVIEDAAQAHGAEYKGRRAGQFGQLACFSFYPGKNLGAYGEAGAVTTDDDAMAEKLRVYRDCGQRAKYDHVLVGFNHRMDGIQGAVLGVKLRHLDRWNEARRRLAASYDRLLTDTGYELPVAPGGYTHIYHVYAVGTDERDRVQAELGARNIGTSIHYPVPVHLQPAFRDLGHGEGAFPHAERLARRMLSLPIYPEMTSEQIRATVEALRAVAPRSGKGSREWTKSAAKPSL